MQGLYETRILLLRPDSEDRHVRPTVVRYPFASAQRLSNSMFSDPDNGEDAFPTSRALITAQTCPWQHGKL